MASPNAERAATAETVNGSQRNDRLGGAINQPNSEPTAPTRAPQWQSQMQAMRTRLQARAASAEILLCPLPERCRQEPPAGAKR